MKYSFLLLLFAGQNLTFAQNIGTTWSRNVALVQAVDLRTQSLVNDNKPANAIELRTWHSGGHTYVVAVGDVAAVVDVTDPTNPIDRVSIRCVNSSAPQPSDLPFGGGDVVVYTTPGGTTYGYLFFGGTFLNRVGITLDLDQLIEDAGTSGLLEIWIDPTKLDKYYTKNSSGFTEHNDAHDLLTGTFEYFPAAFVKVESASLDPGAKKLFVACNNQYVHVWDVGEAPEDLGGGGERSTHYVGRYEISKSVFPTGIKSGYYWPTDTRTQVHDAIPSTLVNEDLTTSPPTWGQTLMYLSCVSLGFWVLDFTWSKTGGAWDHGATDYLITPQTNTLQTQSYDFDRCSVYGWGHSMVIPTVGSYLKLAPIISRTHGNIQFAHSDNDIAPGLENAVWHGVEAARRVME
jgi:hypothetical protein